VDLNILSLKFYNKKIKRKLYRGKLMDYIKLKEKSSTSIPSEEDKSSRLFDKEYWNEYSD